MILKPRWSPLGIAVLLWCLPAFVLALSAIRAFLLLSLIAALTHYLTNAAEFAIASAPAWLQAALLQLTLAALGFQGSLTCYKCKSSRYQ